MLTKFNYMLIMFNTFWVVVVVVFFRTKKQVCWNLAPVCPIFSMWTPIWDHFLKKIWCQYQINHRLKSVSHIDAPTLSRTFFKVFMFVYFGSSSFMLFCILVHTHCKAPGPMVVAKGTIVAFVFFSRNWIWFTLMQIEMYQM